MLQTAQQQVTYRYLLADSWYSSAENMTFVVGLNHHFIFALESCRTLALSEQDRKEGKFQALDTLTFPDKGVLTLYLRSVKQALQVVKQIFIAAANRNKDGSRGILYLVSTGPPGGDTSLDYEQMTTIYKRRWKVEEYHKSLKENTSLGAFLTKTSDTQANHFYASMVAYIKLVFC